MGVNLVLLERSFVRADTRTLFQLWIVYARTAQQNRALKEKLRALREDVGAVAKSCGSVADEEAGTELVASVVTATPEPYPDASPEPEPLRRTRPNVTVDIEATERMADAQELSAARDEVFHLRAEQKECSRVIDAALAHCKRLGKELHERNAEVAELRRRLTELTATGAPSG